MNAILSTDIKRQPLKSGFIHIGGEFTACENKVGNSSTKRSRTSLIHISIT
ncbi:hypothetical protein CEE34_05600 [Candidatus Aerophobetes bacterium Ae_b3a]|nr:MAG: hypothetical protein CEE34_05600 [Candidatus Aerophobetes bacterium Ae_b3a]